MSSLLKNGLTLIGLVLIGGIGYYLFVMQSDSNVSLSSDTQINDAKLTSEQFLRELNEIRTFELSGEFFRDARFRSFVDFTKPISPQPIGRENPFAPVE